MVTVLDASSGSDEFLPKGDKGVSLNIVCSAFNYLLPYQMNVTYDAHPVGAGVAVETVTLNSILLYLQTLRQETCQIRNQNLEIIQRMVSIEAQVSQMMAAPGSAPELSSSNGPVWICPVCRLVLQHERSFKGHIRRLVDPSDRPKCHLNIHNSDHRSLTSRFEGDDFVAQSRTFCIAFYGFVRCAISAKYDASESFALIQSWLAAAQSHDMPFPECQGYSSCSSGDAT